MNYTINHKPKVTTDIEMTYERIIDLDGRPAGSVCSVVYSNGKGRIGGLRAGETVKMEDGLSFVVSR